ncbi:c-type cytochrome domain-containing protein [Daejeonella sp.]|uniref:c-type cytochrome domain-containing protein n=1 Tax=Daejeonella sp. TaxID=2805397 RepID=UPI0027321D51|nr:c-type cytochrome domain-containing protein [Daejeonella sp.]MDP2413565.1 c-type cytochrome domain-containing protein [Daejeonella sp.]
MKINLKAYSGNILLFLNTLIVFLLIFENELIIPGWLQPLGRMHPMLLHFPIVLLLVSLIMEFFQFKINEDSRVFYKSITSRIMFAGILLAAITVIMGIFLSLEDSYEGGEVLNWHKWSGVSIVFLASLIFIFRASIWYNDAMTKAGAIILSFTIVLAGHFGAVLTHGENFVLEPITKSQLVPIEQALVYDHVIQPIFQEKCVSCHSDEKLKGKLKLTDSASIMKGGKTGKLYVPGDPKVSLLLERIHMPLSNKKHMPPSGKPQLSPEEVRILFQWIKDRPDFKKRVMDLPANDSLRILAAARLKPFVKVGEDYDFAAADEETIEDLNNFYRMVSPVSRESPALAVSFFSKNAYNSKSLEELSEIKEQIVSLRLSRMPVKDEDLDFISKLKELRKLDLNFTDINGSGLQDLSALKKLQVLSLSGTKVKVQQLLPLISNKNLRELSVWNTSLTEKDILQLKKVNSSLNIITGFKDDGTTLIQLSKPFLKNNSRVFLSRTNVQLNHPRKDVIIRYTLDGKDPDSLTSPVFKKDIMITENAVIRAKAYKAGWKSSEVSNFTFYRSAFKPDSISLLSIPDINYKGNGTKTLIDGQLAETDINNTNWQGFKEKDMIVILNFKKPAMISSTVLNSIVNVNSSVFPPGRIEVYGGSDLNNLKLLNSYDPKMPAQEDPQQSNKYEVKFKPALVSYLKIIAKPVKKLPSWHPAKGKPAFILFDEILIN